MLKIIKFALSSSFLFFISFGAVADVLECDSCSDSDYKSLVTRWGVTNIEDFNSGAGEYVHVLDMTNRNLASYIVTKSLMQRPGMEPRYFVSAEPTKTPDNIEQKFSSVKSALSALDRSMGDIIIPEHVISDAWEFTGCAYCQTSIENYLDKRMSGNVLEVTTAVSDFGQLVGIINSDLLVRYELQLASGGRVEIDLELNVNPGNLRIEIIKIFDADGNEVPQSSTELEGLAVKISEPSRVETINKFIHRYNLSVPNNTGRVIITDCGNEDCDNI